MPLNQPGPDQFYAMRRHGFVRVATSAPLGRPADVSFNRDNIIAEAQKAHAESVDLLVFPEPCDVISQALRQGDGTGIAKSVQPGNISDQLLMIARSADAAELNPLPP